MPDFVRRSKLILPKHRIEVLAAVQEVRDRRDHVRWIFDAIAERVVRLDLEALLRVSEIGVDHGTRGVEQLAKHVEFLKAEEPHAAAAASELAVAEGFAWYAQLHRRGGVETARTRCPLLGKDQTDAI
jgi:hypothetical protein